MSDAAPPRRGKFALAVFASLALHAALVAPFFLTVPERAAEVQPEPSIAVELVPEPEKEAASPKAPEPAKAPEAPDKQEPQAARQPLAAAPPPPFEASARERPETPPEPQAQPASGTDAKAADTTLPPPVSPDPIETPPPASPDAQTVPPGSPVPSSDPPVMSAAKVEPTPMERVPPAPAAAMPEAEPPMTPTEQAAFTPAKPAVPAPRPSPSAASTEPVLKPARTLYAQDMLSDPRVRGALGKLPPNRRIVQMCSIEALEQVRHAGVGLTPDLLVPFGSAGGRIAGTRLSASGGAVRARGAWRNLSFDCSVDAGFETVTAFRFSLGANIPAGEWRARGLLVE